MYPYPTPARRGSCCADLHGLRPNSGHLADGTIAQEGIVIPTDEALIEEALETNHAEVRSEKTLVACGGLPVHAPTRHHGVG